MVQVECNKKTQQRGGRGQGEVHGFTSGHDDHIGTPIQWLSHATNARPQAEAHHSEFKVAHTAGADLTSVLFLLNIA